MAQTHPHSVRYSVEESTFCGGPLRVKKGAVLMRYSSPRLFFGFKSEEKQSPHGSISPGCT